ncbi:MAG: hypothetical protein H0U03_10815 [Actinobacteria bacterium]|nr:hypothetical protein [Actinomycetota bacterium]
MDLIYGAGKLDRRVQAVEDLLREWRVREADWGQLYLEFKPATPPDVLVVEDLAVTMLINSRVAGQAAAAVLANGSSVDLSALPDKPLEETTSDERRQLADMIGTMTSWPWVGASLATKTLHKKRPHLVPVLDNQAIFGAYMNSRWPAERSLMDTIKSTARPFVRRWSGLPTTSHARRTLRHGRRSARSSRSGPESSYSTASGGSTSAASSRYRQRCRPQRHRADDSA